MTCACVPLAASIGANAPRQGSEVQNTVAQADVVPPSSKCPTDRRLPAAVRYAVLPLSGEIGDGTATGGTEAAVDALMEQSGMIAIKGQNARQSLGWLRENYSNPVR